MANGYKTGGRNAGTPNRLTKELRTLLKNILANEIEKIPEVLEQLEPKDKMDMIIKLLPYTLPKVEPEKYAISEGGALDDWG